MTKSERRLLLIDDDQDLAELLRDFLARHGYMLDWADRPSVGMQRLEAHPDLVLLDIMLPEADGFEVCRRIRASGSVVPVIMLTARGDDADRIRGLRGGADDYLPKPFNPLELLARIEAVLRRIPPAPPAEPSAKGLDPDRRTLWLDGREVPLTPSEYRIMEAMVAQPGRAFTRDQLLELMDEAGAVDSFDRAIDIHVSRLRAKLEDDPKQPKHLLTVRGVGYRFEW
jgi:DNA-binding response OmpR family regulator